MPTEYPFDQVIEQFYAPLYRFAFSLAKNSHEAADLTQQTFFIYAEKYEKIRDTQKTKSWLFTTLYREFLRIIRKKKPIYYDEPEVLEQANTSVPPQAVRSLEAHEAMEKLNEIDEIYRTPLSLFYLSNNSYKEISKILDVPIGTIMSRIARGKGILKQLLIAA